MATTPSVALTTDPLPTAALQTPIHRAGDPTADGVFRVDGARSPAEAAAVLDTDRSTAASVAEHTYEDSVFVAVQSGIGSGSISHG